MVTTSVAMISSIRGRSTDDALVGWLPRLQLSQSVFLKSKFWFGPTYLTLHGKLIGCLHDLYPRFWSPSSEYEVVWFHNDSSLFFRWYHRQDSLLYVHRRLPSPRRTHTPTSLDDGNTVALFTVSLNSGHAPVNGCCSHDSSSSSLTWKLYARKLMLHEFSTISDLERASRSENK